MKHAGNKHPTIDEAFKNMAEVESNPFGLKKDAPPVIDTNVFSKPKKKKVAKNNKEVPALLASNSKPLSKDDYNAAFKNMSATASVLWKGVTFVAENLAHAGMMTLSFLLALTRLGVAKWKSKKLVDEEKRIKDQLIAEQLQKEDKLRSSGMEVYGGYNGR